MAAEEKVAIGQKITTEISSQISTQISTQWENVWRIASTPLFELGGNKISLISIVVAIVTFIITIQVAKFIEKLVARWLLTKSLDSGVRGAIERFTRYGVLTIGILITLDTVGINLQSLAAISAVLMVGIGFGLQNITQNFISGLIILLERPIKQGDIIEVGGTMGRVHDIRARSTLIHTRDDIAIVVPNSQFISEQVVNESFSGEKIRLKIEIGVAYGSDVSKVKEILLKIANQQKGVMGSPPPAVIFSNFGDSALQFILYVWTSRMWTREILCSDIRFGIDEAFRRESIQIPFPQRDLHIRSSDLSKPL